MLTRWSNNNKGTNVQFRNAQHYNMTRWDCQVKTHLHTKIPAYGAEEKERRDDVNVAMLNMCDDWPFIKHQCQGGVRIDLETLQKTWQMHGNRQVRSTHIPTGTRTHKVRKRNNVSRVSAASEMSVKPLVNLGHVLKQAAKPMKSTKGACHSRPTERMQQKRGRQLVYV